MFTNRISALHAGNVVLQIHRDLETALSWTEDHYPDESQAATMSAHELATLLQHEGLPAVAWVAAPKDILEIARDAHADGWTVLLRLRPQVAPRHQRWGILWSDDRKAIAIAECSGEGERAEFKGNMVSFLTGEAVIVEQNPGPNRVVHAFAARAAD